MSEVISHAFNVLISLKQTCLNYITYNFDLVDSLHGLPEIVTKELFDSYIINKPCVCDAKSSYFIDRWQKDMSLFVCSHKQNVLKSIDLSGKWLFLSLQIDHLFCFLYLEELDVSSCKIGDNHDILYFIGKLEFLRKLSLKNNNLSSDGVKNLTLYRRRARKGLSKLEYLRLEQTKIDNTALIFLQSLPLLKVIVVDNEKMKLFCDRQLTFNHCCRPNEHSFDISTDRVCVNEGWAIQLLENCMKKTSKNDCSASSSKLFYRKRKFPSKCTITIDKPLVKVSAVFMLCDDKAHHLQKVTQASTANADKEIIKRKHVLCDDRNKHTGISGIANVISTESSLNNDCQLKLDPSILEIYCTNYR